VSDTVKRAPRLNSARFGLSIANYKAGCVGLRRAFGFQSDNRAGHIATRRPWLNTVPTAGKK